MTRAIWGALIRERERSWRGSRCRPGWACRGRIRWRRSVLLRRRKEREGQSRPPAKTSLRGGRLRDPPQTPRGQTPRGQTPRGRTPRGRTPRGRSHQQIVQAALAGGKSLGLTIAWDQPAADRARYRRSPHLVPRKRSSGLQKRRSLRLNVGATLPPATVLAGGNNKWREKWRAESPASSISTRNSRD